MPFESSDEPGVAVLEVPIAFGSALLPSHAPSPIVSQSLAALLRCLPITPSLSRARRANARAALLYAIVLSDRYCPHDDDSFATNPAWPRVRDRAGSMWW